MKIKDIEYSDKIKEKKKNKICICIKRTAKSIIEAIDDFIEDLYIN